MAAASSRRCAHPATSAPAASTRARSMTELESTIWPCSRVDPAGTSSSPVDTTATRGRGCTDRAGTFAAAASARWPGPSRVPAGSTRSPVRTSSPRRRSERPTAGASCSATSRGAAVGELDRHDGIGPLGHRCAGHDPQRVADREDVVPGVPGGDVTGDRQHDRRPGAGPGELGRPHGVAVHGRVVEARQVDRGHDVVREHQAEGRPDGHGRGGERGDEGQHRGPVLGERAHHTSPCRCAPSAMVRTAPVTRTSPVHTTSAPKVTSPSTRRLVQSRIEGTPRGKRSSNPVIWA